ncbi:transmembrane channel-like protein 7 isoform X2 [Polypterus senegalus]|uniref:transmembrane channel-like protein 7 isoform X2 n=1 Tax=Polypterus senegalus TaxID=55291 RepID=UPI0019630C94|nr:transmembrane channel-like protein 7 isoform X2 [Polypterus senegalus]
MDRVETLTGGQPRAGSQPYLPDKESTSSGRKSKLSGNEILVVTPRLSADILSFFKKMQESGQNPENFTIREMPLSMAQKREIRQVRKFYIPIVTKWQSWKLKKMRSLKQLQENLEDVTSYLDLWTQAFHRIGANFGNGIESYFRFLRFLVFLNLMSFFLIGCFVLIPNITIRSLKLTTTSNSSIKTDTECTYYNPTPTGLVNFFNYVLDILSGTGMLEFSYLFYGFYESGEVDLVKKISYNIPVSYLVTCLCYMMFCIIWIVLRSGSGFKALVLIGGESLTHYGSLVFSAWDFRLKSEKFIKLKQKTIRFEFQMELEEAEAHRAAVHRTMSENARLYSYRVALNLVVIACIIGAFYCIYLATQESQRLQNEQDFVTKTSFLLGLLIEYLPSVVITAANFVVPMICDFVMRFEAYTLSMQIKVILFRAVFLRFAGLGVLLFSLWTQITCGGDITATDCKACEYNYGQYPCWETRIGQEMYKLMIFDLLTITLVTLLVEFPRRMLVDFCSWKLVQLWGYQQFLVPQNILQLIYGQTVVWIGVFFCPLLPLLNTIKFILVFYCKKMTLFRNCRPAEKTFRSARSNFFFRIILLIGLFVSCVPLGYSVAKIQPSKGCGPFRSLSRIWDVVPNSVAELPITTQQFLYFLGSQAFAVPLFLLCCIVLSYILALSAVYKDSITQLRAKLKGEGREKKFLLMEITDASKGH